MFSRKGFGGLVKNLFTPLVVLVAMFMGGGAAARADGPTPEAGVPTPQAGFLTDQQVAEYKAAHDTDPHIPLTADQQALLATKEQMVTDWLGARAQMAREKSPGAASGSPCADFDGSLRVLAGDIVYVTLSYGIVDAAADLNGNGVVNSGDITIAVGQYGTVCQRAGVTFIGRTYQGQVNGYYCGPAAVSEALVVKGITNVDQNAAAVLLTTTSEGTPWSGWNGGVAGVPTNYDTQHPTADVLNYKLSSSWYMPQEVPYSPTSSNIATYIGDLTFDINNHWALLGDAYEVNGGPGLRGHPNPPIDQPILHWFTISGYEDSGNGSNYMDSSTTVWSAVQGWNTYFPSSTLVSILGGRGYVW